MMIQPPTDNLYKFMAIIGLLLWIGGAIYPWVKAYEIEKELIILEAKIEYEQKKPDQSSLIELKIQNNLTKLMLKATIAFAALGILSFAIGSFLMYFGFRLWYIKVQKPLDEQLIGK